MEQWKPAGKLSSRMAPMGRMAAVAPKRAWGTKMFWQQARDILVGCPSPIAGRLAKLAYVVAGPDLTHQTPIRHDSLTPATLTTACLRTIPFPAAPAKPKDRPPRTPQTAHTQGTRSRELASKPASLVPLVSVALRVRKGRFEDAHPTRPRSGPHTLVHPLTGTLYHVNPWH